MTAVAGQIPAWIGCGSTGECMHLWLSLAREAHGGFEWSYLSSAIGWASRDGAYLKIVTEFDHPPIPDRSNDWSAVLDGYEPGDPIGRGPTEVKAIEDLRIDMATRGWCTACGDRDFWDIGIRHVERSGSALNHSVGLTEHWWAGTRKCVSCGVVVDDGDSSL